MMHSCLPDKLLHGGDYNPDQWLKYPEILEEDIRLMKKAHTEDDVGWRAPTAWGTA